MNNNFKIRKGKNLVCVNSDDTGIMPTTLRTEFELLREAAKKHCKSNNKIDKWIDKLIKEGVRIYELYNQTPTVERQNDYSRVLNKLFD